jgi:hypothetical protein
VRGDFNIPRFRIPLTRDNHLRWELSENKLYEQILMRRRDWSNKHANVETAMEENYTLKAIG